MSDVKKIKPTLSKGTRDFLPHEVSKRNYILNTLQSVFQLYGFQQIETPAIEKLETLTGKYGDEGDKLLFKILNSGDYLQSVPDEVLASRNFLSATRFLADKGLRYDLTVPLARYVVQHQGDLAFPFKRYHIGPVWRADRPQKGRYQEFYQCDADIIGTTSLYADVELTNIYIQAFAKFGLDVTIRINHRKILEALAAYAECSAMLGELTVLIDKLDKIGWDGFKMSLDSLTLSEGQKQKIITVLQVPSLDDLRPLFSGIPEGGKGIEEVNFVLCKVPNEKVVFDITLARGLDYYTGTIWEVLVHDAQIGSLGGGGRFDNLTEMFGGQNMSGVGISFGIERIYDVLEDLNRFPESIAHGVRVLFVPRDSSAEEFAFGQVQALREAGISAEVFLGNVKKQKQFSYSEQKGISYLVEIGDNEIQSGIFRLRQVKERSEEGKGFTLAQLIDKLR